MIYDQQILKILAEVGQRGISVGVLAKHIYNLNTTLFSAPDLQEVRQYVGQYLLRNSKSAHSLVESTGQRGYYRLNTQGNDDARQLMLDFREESLVEETDPEKPQQDLSLSLFPDF